MIRLIDQGIAFQCGNDRKMLHNFANIQTLNIDGYPRQFGHKRLSERQSSVINECTRGTKLCLSNDINNHGLSPLGHRPQGSDPTDN